jgi:aminoglycoside phosphotransferase (APT) family kinase protein
MAEARDVLTAGMARPAGCQVEGGRQSTWMSFSEKIGSVMDFRPIERSAGAFQEPVPAGTIAAMCRHAFAGHGDVISVVENPWGTYNNTFRVDLDGGVAVILRVAPSPTRHGRSEHELLRNEYAAGQHLTSLADLLPRTLAADFSHDIIDRDYVFQSMIPGVPAPEGLQAYQRPRWASFFRGLGAVNRSLHEIRGPSFGRVAGPRFAAWSDAVVAMILDVAADLEHAGLDAGDVRHLARVAEQRRDVLDEVVEPRLLHGDLWTVNVLIDPAAPEPTITGICDLDRASFGDPASDWSIRRAGERPGTERDAFWETYGRRETPPSQTGRSQIYLALHLAENRLERHRLGRLSEIPATYHELGKVLAD